MTKDEIREATLNGAKKNKDTEVPALLQAVCSILVNKGITTSEEIKELKDKYIEKQVDKDLENLKDGEVSVSEVFDSLFGSLLK